MKRASVAVGLLVAAGVMSLAGVAQAQQVRCEVLSIQASSDGAAVGSALAPYRSQLMSPPLNAFTSFVLSDSQTLTMSAGASQPLTLGHGITGELRFLATPREGRHRLRIILRRGGQTLVNSQVAVSAGRPFFVAGPIIPGGTLVVGIICR